MKKFLSITLAITTVAWLVGTFYVPSAKAAVVDGDVVSPDATYTDADGNTYYPYDVFIVKIVGSKTFKRLVLNPQVFDSYGHLKWENIKKISASTVAGYTTSSLVREINDTKVYKLIPDGDEGTKQWVESLDCFNSKGYDWDSVYIINAVDRDNYTTGASVCGGGGEGALTLSLASDSPAAATIPPNAQGVTFLKVKVDGTGTINQVTVTRKGAGAVADFGDIYIYKDGVRLVSGRALSSATSKVTFINLNIAAPATFEVVADMYVSGTTYATTGNVNYFAIEGSSDVTANGTVGGVFPLNGNPMGISGTTAGTLTVARSGASANNATIGATEVEISQFKVTTATEGAYVKRIRLFNNGDADNNLITNLKLKDNSGTTLATATSINSSGYLDFVFASPYYIIKGDSAIFRVYADIGATKPQRTIKLYLELRTDILATGNVYGYGMYATITSFSTNATAVTVTCKGGDLTLNKVGPSAGKIGTTTSDTVFLEFTMSAAADITIKRTELIFCIDTNGDGTYSDASVSAGGDIEDIKIKDKDSGVIVAGPKDGTAFNDGGDGSGETGYQSCPGSKNGVSEAYTDTIDLSAGTTKTYQVTADIKTSNTDSGQEIVSGTKLKFILYSYASLVGSGTVNYMKYAGTNDAVPNTAIVPSGDIAGEEMTIESASLALTLAASPSGTDKVYIKGQAGVEAVGIIFTAGTASEIKINSITLISYTKEASGGSWAAGKDTNYVKDSIGSVYIYDKDTGALVPGSSAKGFTSGDDYEYVVYTGLSWTIPAGESKTLLVKGNISSAAPASASSADTWISFDIETAADDVSAVDKDGNTVTAINDGPNTATSPTTYFGIAEYGSLAIDQATDTPDKSIVVMGSTDNEVSKFKLTGTYESWNIEKFSIVLDDGGGIDEEDRDNFSAVKIKYQTQSQWGTSNWTVTSGKTFGSTASLAFSFSGDSRMYVPKNDNAYVTVLVSILDYNGGNGAKSKKPFKIYDIDGGTSSFSAYGAQSGKLLNSYTTDSAADTDFNLHFVARSKPVFAKVAWSGGETELARFSITAVGWDVIFKNTDIDTTDGANFNGSTTPASAYLEFDVIASGTDGASTSFYLYDWNEVVLSSAPNAGVYDPACTEFDSNDLSCVATIGFHFETGNYTRTIAKDQTREFHINIDGADITDFNHSDEYIYLKLTGDEGGNLATGSPLDRTIIYDDDTAEEGISGGGDPEERFMVPGDIKNIGPLPLIFRTLRGTVTPS